MSDESASVADWSVLEEPGVSKVLRQVVSRVARDFAPTIEDEGAEQEAQIILATKAETARAKLADGGERFLSQWLWQQLVMVVDVEVARARRMTTAALRDDGTVEEPEYLKGFREDDGEDHPVEVRSL